MKRICYLLSLFLVHVIMSVAQVSIGTGAKEVQDFSILELISDSTDVKGLRMPQLTGDERNILTNTPAFQAEKDNKALGLTIFNKSTGCIEYWNGSDWISRCEGEICPAPNKPNKIVFSKAGPLRLNETFTASLAFVEGLVYTWTIPPEFVFVGSSTGNSVTLRAVKPGIHGLHNIGVRVTNYCGNTSPVRAGEGSIEVLNCETEPLLSDIDLSKIVVTNTKSGTGTDSDPYKVVEGNTFTVSYPYDPSSLIVYNFSLDAEGNTYFEIISQGKGLITLRAKAYTDVGGVHCGEAAIGIVATNDCGQTNRIATKIHVAIEEVVTPCPKPNTPGPITFSKSSLLVNEIFTASVPDELDMTYVWTVYSGFAIVGANNVNPVTIRAIKTGYLNLTGISVTATNTCGNTSDAAYGSGILEVKDPESVPPGEGSLIGKTCFDIAYGNDDQFGCGTVNSRYPYRTDFSLRTPQDPATGNSSPPYTGVQVYTFKHTGTISNVRFVVEDPTGTAVEKYTQDISNRKLTVEFKASLNETLRNVKREDAVKVYIYAIYEEGGVEKSVKLSLSLQDCACCGAKLANGGWLNFMCHNLGADESFDPFVYHSKIKGSLFQWGRKADGHELRTSPKVIGSAMGSNGELDANGQVIGNKKGQFITNSVVSRERTDWTNPSNDNLWTDNVKAKGDPCPQGWKVPSAAQWREVLANNTWLWNNETQYGAKIGDLLFLPVTGSRDGRSSGKVREPEDAMPNPTWGYYWSSTKEENTDLQARVANHMAFTRALKAHVGTDNGITYRIQGRSVRCVEDK